jgi:hypothetical protein
MISVDRIKKAILDLVFRPVDLDAPLLEPDQVLRLGEDPDLFDPTRNAPPQRGNPAIRIYHDVTIWPAQSVAQKREALALDTFIDSKHTEVLVNLNALRHYPTVSRRGWATTIESVYPTGNYYHFLVDALPRIWALHHPDLRDLSITLFLTRPLQSEKEDLLRSLLPSNVSIRSTHRFSRVQVDHYVHLPYLSKDRIGYNRDRIEMSGGFIPQEYLDFFREHMLQKSTDADVPSCEYLYVTRRGADMRRLQNEGEVSGYLEDRGFATIRPEDYSLTEQARLFDSAQVVVAQHGAALANLIYMRDGAVIEIFSSSDMPQYYTQCARTLGLEYEPITLNRGYKNADAHLPIEKLDDALANIDFKRSVAFQVCESAR